MEDTDAQDSLRRILAHSSPNSPPHHQTGTLASPSPPPTAPRTTSSPPVALQYPTIHVSRSSPLSSRKKHTRKVSWADQRPNANRASSQGEREHAKHGPGSAGPQQGHTDSGDSGSSGSGSETLSLNSPFESAPPSPRLNLNNTNSSRPRSSTKATMDHRSTSIWDPDDSEWAEVDANKVYSTFKASYKKPAPALYPPRNPSTNALTSLGSSIHDTITSFLPVSFSTTKKKEVDGANEDESLSKEEEENIKHQLEELTNTYYCDPKGDLADEIMQQVFVTGSKYFPAALAAAPSQPQPRRMHIIDLDVYFSTRDPLLQHAKPRLCDAVATILSHTNQQCLEAFLDPNIEDFAYRREIDRNKAGLTLIVRRKGNEVVAGAYRNFGFSLQWTLYVRSLVSITGEWHEVYATLKPGSTPIVKGLPQWGMFEPDGVVQSGEGMQSEDATMRKVELLSSRKADHDAFSPTNPKFMLYQSRVLANYLLWDVWVRFNGLYECRAIWEANGKENEVRLKRALVGVRGAEEEEE
ncbi:hypothetical protein N0V83_000706 [Neocucurbitaria cava]|uniref:Uncharacterized protein n=1 Tax=Neocucurbitaria cava TaxID=798079 RepID=A0A9W8YIC3_9PLEO|nr:hypothetical protein N0V83_000706 [Neocucurbitaria cava]